MVRTLVISGGSSGIGKATASLFAERGYIAEKVRAVDLFPMTAHVETVVQLSKGDIDKVNSERSVAV